MFNSTANDLSLIMFQDQLQIFLKKSFHYSETKVWNNLPLTIRKKIVMWNYSEKIVINFYLKILCKSNMCSYFYGLHQIFAICMFE